MTEYYTEEVEILTEDIVVEHPFKNALDAIDFQAATFDEFGTSVYYAGKDTIEINGVEYTLSSKAKEWFQDYEHQISTKPIRQIEIKPITLEVTVPENDIQLGHIAVKKEKPQ